MQVTLEDINNCKTIEEIKTIYEKIEKQCDQYPMWFHVMQNYVLKRLNEINQEVTQ